jgi:16S rRNA (guanine966-N2)-methyltransferase
MPKKPSSKQSPKKTAHKPRPSMTHQVRIIGGQWKRTPLPVLDVEGLRPTPDRVRETVFNWINHLIDGSWSRMKCLDLFAGIVRGDALMATQGMARNAAKFDLIFLDPPYHQNWLEKMLPGCAQLLAKDGMVYVESEESLVTDTPPAWLADWEIVRADNAGMVFYHLLQSKKLPEVQA